MYMSTVSLATEVSAVASKGLERSKKFNLLLPCLTLWSSIVAVVVAVVVDVGVVVSVILCQ